MPLYTFHCDKCGHSDDYREPTPQEHTCPDCGSRMRRVYSPSLIKGGPTTGADDATRDEA